MSLMVSGSARVPCLGGSTSLARFQHTFQHPLQPPHCLSRQRPGRRQSSLAAAAEIAGTLTTQATDAAATAAADASASACSGLGCSQELIDSVTNPFSALAGSIPTASLLPGLAAVLAVGGILAWRVAVYGQREYIVAAMCRKYVPKKGAKVLQIGGTTRDAFYYPSETTKVTVVGDNINAGLMEQAGIQAGVPVEARKQLPTDLSFIGTGSVDAVVAFNALHMVGSKAAQYFAEVARILKPGAPLIFIDRVTGDGVAAVAQPLVGSITCRIGEDRLQELRKANNLVNVTGEIALKGQDPHAVGVAFRAGGTGPGPGGGSTSSGADDFERQAVGRQRRSKGGKKAKGFAPGKR